MYLNQVDEWNGLWDVIKSISKSCLPYNKNLESSDGFQLWPLIADAMIIWFALLIILKQLVSL